MQDSLSESNGTTDLALLKRVARKELPFWASRFLYQPISIYITWAAIELRLNATVITLLGAFCLFAAAVCYGLPVPATWIAGAALVFLYVVFDHADGEISRYECWRLGRNGDLQRQFYDTCCHAGETVVILAIAMRLYATLGHPWWLLVLALLVLFPGAILPWQRYCEILVKHQAERSDPQGQLPPKLLRPSSFVRPAVPPGRRRPPGPIHLASIVSRTLGSPNYLLTLVACTTLDVIPAVGAVTWGKTQIPYLLIWLTTTALHRAAAAVKSVVVYGRRLRLLA